MFMLYLCVLLNTLLFPTGPSSWHLKQPIIIYHYILLEVLNTEHKLTLANLPEELLTRTIQCYLKTNYLIDPEVITKTISGEEWGTNEIIKAVIISSSHHMEYVGPEVEASISSTCQIPWDHIICSSPNARERATRRGIVHKLMV